MGPFLRDYSIIHTERWTHSWLNNVQKCCLSVLLVLFWLHHGRGRKDTRLFPCIYIHIPGEPGNKATLWQAVFLFVFSLFRPWISPILAQYKPLFLLRTACHSTSIVVLWLNFFYMIPVSVVTCNIAANLRVKGRFSIPVQCFSPVLQSSTARLQLISNLQYS